MYMRKLLAPLIFLLNFQTAISQLEKQATVFSASPRDAKFHTEDNSLFWKVFIKGNSVAKTV